GRLSIAAAADTSGKYGKRLRAGSRMSTDPGRLILRGGASAGLGLALRLGARLVFLVIAAQLFGAALFGAFSLAIAVVELAVAVGGLGMKRYLFKLLEDPGER